MKSALVFGGSRGIGAIGGRYLTRNGWQLTVCSRTAADIAGVRNTVAGDVRIYDEVKRAFSSHMDTFDSAPLVTVNCAAIQGPIGKTWEIDPESVARTVDTNLLGSFHVVKCAVNAMPEGSIVLFSGGGAVFARPHFSAYACSKTAVLRLVDNVAEELALGGRTNLIINAVAPGAVATEMLQEALDASEHLSSEEEENIRDTISNGGTDPVLIETLIGFLVDPRKNRGLSGRLIHVREPYQEFVDTFAGELPRDAGKITRKGFDTSATRHSR